MKKVTVIDFAQIFKFAEEQYGIDWNSANDIFFNGRLEYTKHTSVDMGDWIEYIDLNIEEKEKAGDYTKEEVLAMTDNDKSYVITAAYLESLDIQKGEDILIDCS
jgi:hypothetical protein